MYKKSLFCPAYILFRGRSQLVLPCSKMILPFLSRGFASSKCYSANILDLVERGIWKDRFPSSCSEFEKNITSKSAVVYAGFDPTADSLHIGNLLVLNALIHFQRNGHKVIAVIGGATARVGDPSGKNEERPILPLEYIDENAQKIKENIETIFRNHEEFIWKKIGQSNKRLEPIRILNNYSWYKHVNVIDYLREFGTHMRMGVLMSRSTIEDRLKSNKPLSYTEFSYQILQAYDWHYLYKNYDCTVQVGGSDQMGNIVNGHQLISRKEDAQVTGLTVPLITSETGDKLGKTTGTPVWLSPHKTSPYEFYQFFLRVKDSEVENLLKLLTFIPMYQIEQAMEVDPGKMLPQKKLAQHLTVLVYGEEGLLKAQRATSLIFSQDSTVLAEMDTGEVMDLFQGSVIRSLPLEPGMSILDLTMRAGCFPTERRAVEIIECGGLCINQAQVNSPTLALIEGVHILPNGISLVRVGKRNYYIIEWIR